MKRDILNHLNQKVGELELPEGTSEEVWLEKLAPYAKAPSSPVPESVTPRQIRIALIVSGVSLDAIEGAINSMPEPSRSVAKVTWEYSTAFLRSNPLLTEMAPILGMSNEQVDNLFRLAATL